MTSALDPVDYTPASFRFDLSSGSSLRDRSRDVYNRLRYPLMSAGLRRSIPETVRLFKPDLVLGHGVGVPRSMTRTRISRLLDRPVSRMLVIGCGTAWDLGQWVRLRPREVVCVDLHCFRRAWNAVGEVVRAHGIDVSFHQDDIGELKHVPDEWADVVIADAVFEHCVDLSAVLRGVVRKVRARGIIYGSYGPLWYSPGGDHFSTRAGLGASFNHLLLLPDEYAGFFQRHLEKVEDPQSGGRYVPLNLFSRLSSDQYLSLYERLGLARRFLAFELSPQTAAFRRDFAEKWRALLERYPTVRPEELSIKGHYVILQC